jgi:cytochrome c biogenesis protein CcmG, thiol:disulfide interchange protein DsbE
MGVTGVPETFVIDKGGRVRYRHVGPISDEDWQKTFEPLLIKLRNET